MNFFATWCMPLEEHDDLARFFNRHAVAGDATVVGIVFADDIDAVRRFRNREGGDWPMVIDPDGEIALGRGPRSWSPAGPRSRPLSDPLRHRECCTAGEHLASVWRA